MQAVASAPTPDLDRAVAKLRGVVDAELRLPVARPAVPRGRAARVRRRPVAAVPVPVASGVGRDRPGGAPVPGVLELGALVRARPAGRRGGGEVLPGRPHDRRRARRRRVRPAGRRRDPASGSTSHEHERTVRVRMRADSLESLPAPHRLGEADRSWATAAWSSTSPSAATAASSTCWSASPADAEVVAPAEYAELRREHALEVAGRLRELTRAFEWDFRPYPSTASRRTSGVRPSRCSVGNGAPYRGPRPTTVTGTFLRSAPCGD